MVELQAPQIDPNFDGLGRMELLIRKSITLLENGKVKDAQNELHYLTGMVSALKNYFDLELKSEYNKDNN